jgi:sugar lactone lactonase YvrE
MSGLVFGEQPRWHEGRLWFSDWGTQEVIAVDLDGNSEVIFRGPSFPLCVDWLPDRTLLLVSARDGLLLRRDQDGSLVTYGDLKTASDPPAINELVVDGRGNAYVNGGGFNMMAGEEFAPGVIALVAPDGSARQVAGGLAFPNGMLVMPGGSTLIVAESYAKRLTAFDIDADGGLSNRRVWADLGDGVPDSLCADA